MPDDNERRSGMNEVLRGIKRIEKRMDKHSGEGQDTTHALIEERLDSQDRFRIRVKTTSTLVIGTILAIWALVKSKLLGRI